MTKTLKTTIAVSAALLLLSACAGTRTDSAYELMREQQEQQAYVQGKEIEHWEKRKPSNQQMAVHLLQQTLDQGKYFAALAYADAMQAEYGQAPELLILRAEALRQTGQLPEAVQIYQNLTKTANSARAWQGLGLIAGGQGDYAQAAIYLARAASLEPADAELQSDLAYASLRAGQPDQARLALGKAAELDPDNGRILSNMALFLLVNGEPNRAAYVMEHAGMPQTAQTAVLDMATQIVQELRQLQVQRQQQARQPAAVVVNTSAPQTSQSEAPPATSNLHRPLLESMSSVTH